MTNLPPLQQRLDELNLGLKAQNQDLTSAQINQLREYAANDELVMRFTRDIERFSEQKVSRWLEKGRDIYSIVDSDDNLLGICWFGPKPCPVDKKNYDYTLAMRLYGALRGKKLANIFLVWATKEFLHKNKNSLPIGIWIETSNNNLPMIKICEKNGYKLILDDSNKAIYAREFSSPDF